MLDVEFALETIAAPIEMVRRADRRRLLPYALLIQDMVLIYLAFAGAYSARYTLALGPKVPHAIGFSGYQEFVLWLMSIMLAVLAVKGAYRTRMATEAVDDLLLVASAATITVSSIVVISFMLHRFEYSRSVIVYVWISLIMLLGLGRLLSRIVQGICYRRGWKTRRLLVVGASDVGKMIMQSVRSRPDLGYDVVGFVDRRGSLRSPDFGRFQRLGSLSDLPELIALQDVDEVIVALPGSAHEELSPVVRLCETNGIALKFVPDLFNVGLSRVRVDDIAGIPLLDVQAQSIRRLEGLTKRALDLLIGSILLMASIPIIALAALLIRLESEGPIFLRQERMGKNGRPFTCYKLRSMRPDAHQLLPQVLSLNEATGPIFKMRNDPRCTHVGRHLRRMSLDELPQIWNVVCGDMALVGPRPPLATETEKYESWQLRRLEVKPGLTGIWQVSGRSDLTFDEMMMMDILYVDMWTLILDLKILLRTATAVLAGRGAY